MTLAFRFGFVGSFTRGLCRIRTGDDFIVYAGDDSSTTRPELGSTLAAGFAGAGVFLVGSIAGAVSGVAGAIRAFSSVGFDLSVSPVPRAWAAENWRSYPEP